MSNQQRCTTLLIRIFWFGVLLFVINACTRTQVTRPETLTVPAISSTPSLTPVPTLTVTPSPTPTPTPTAQPFAVEGSPRAYTLFDPAFQSGAACGWVDTFDYPLDPPDGATASGGRDFGRYRERYDKFHAGEDWRFVDGDNFGQPVYAIGHGEVTYAESEGWGADKGVVIVRHTFPNGRKVLSFYGHLDPPSVTLNPGDCITRGQIIGQIGRPRTPPHLHFEIRAHLPYTPGGGYWSTDPAQSGWLPPSQTIAAYRLQVSPGTQWYRSTDESSQFVYVLDENQLILAEGDQLVGLDLENGTQIWSLSFDEVLKQVQTDTAGNWLYAVELPNQLRAYQMNTEPLLVWERELSSALQLSLMPLPGGGILVSDAQGGMTAISTTGETMWREPDATGITNWIHFKDTLIFTTNTTLWAGNAEGAVIWEEAPTGIPVAAGNQLWLYAADGIYRLDIEQRTAQHVYTLSAGFANQRAALGLSNGGLLLAHTDTHDRRLLSLNANGSLVWEYSISGLVEGTPEIFTLNGEIYALFAPTNGAAGSYNEISVFWIDPNNGEMLRIFQSGSRNNNPLTTWAIPIRDRQLLIHIEGAGMLLFDPQAARQRMEN
ncbi:MAG: peptidoglycan DD-metalloendopeptidase family protein [Chloroflexi bacterium]|jgi:murein DD-endopeptidase MepM/ murein hydrolase activator NlpD|nr:peptidoglycan DD-metalloendopeptidase family protein [Chloroflexota bacterium]